MKKTIIGFIIAVIVIGGSAFYGGLQYGKSQAANALNSARQQRQVGGAGFNNGGAGRRGGANGGIVSGDIIAKDDKSLTLKLQNGGSKIIFLSGSTQFSKFVAGGATDLAVGNTVMVNGAANSDGSITAQMIQSRPPRQANAASTPR